MLNLWHCVLVLLDNLLHLLVGGHVLFTDSFACFDVLKEGLKSFSLSAAWAFKDEQLHNLTHVVVEADGRLPAAAVSARAHPAALGFDAMLAVESITLRALYREGRRYELAQSADKEVKRVTHPRCFINLARTWLRHFYLYLLAFATANFN